MSAIQSIVIRPVKRGAIQHLLAAHILPEGIDGDHFVRPETRRSVTLVSAADLATVAVAVGFDGDLHGACRRNICVDSFPDSNMEGKIIALGEDVILEITCYCAPCKRMDENFGEGAVAAFQNKGGWGAIVIEGGEIKVGDELRVL